MISSLFRRVAGFVLALTTLAPALCLGQEIKVTLLGTGAPPPVMHRSGPSILIEAAGQKYLIDAGRGALQRLGQVNVRWQDVDGVLFTHLHSDHVVGFPDLWLTGWLTPGRQRPLQVRGPIGTTKMVRHLEQAYEFDIRTRSFDEGAAPEGVVVDARDISEGVVLERGGLKITAFEVDHAPVKPAFGYRVDYAGRSVVVSGDTRVSTNLIRHAQGVDLLVHEVVAPESFKRVGMRPERAKAVTELHVTPEQAGEVFAKTRPRLAVYSHIVPPIATEHDLIPATRTKYSGAVEVGEDLMVIEVGDKIEVRRTASTSP